MRQVGFAFAQVRMQARLAERPTSVEWQMIETGRDFAQSLDATTRTSLVPFVTRLGRESDEASIEKALRQSWADLVAEAASWVPKKWRPALLWITALPHLRLVEARRAPELVADEASKAEAVGEFEVSEAWRERLMSRLPVSDPALVRDLAPLFDRFLEGPPRPESDAAALSVHLETLFRTRAQEPVAAFAWLGLMALVMERLRGALLRAVLFPARQPVEGA